jgi:hypothetical protein
MRHSGVCTTLFCAPCAYHFFSFCRIVSVACLYLCIFPPFDPICARNFCHLSLPLSCPHYETTTTTRALRNYSSTIASCPDVVGFTMARAMLVLCFNVTRLFWGWQMPVSCYLSFFEFVFFCMGRFSEELSTNSCKVS